MHWLTPCEAHEISEVSALEILDSRSRPTLQVTVRLVGGVTASAGVPSGASTGSREAVERRDGGSRYGGLGVQQTAQAISGEIAATLRGRAWRDLREIDLALIELDGTDTKSRLGANAIVGVSMACARAFARADRQPLWEWLISPGVEPALPVPHFNVLNGGAHARNELDFQEFMIAPLGAPSMAEAVRAGAEVYAALRALLSRRGLATGLGDEGGFAPEIAEPEDVLKLLGEAISDAGYVAGRSGVAIALDPAASEFRGADGRYRVAGQWHSSADMIARYEAMADRYPIWLIEDGLAEDDWEGWTDLTRSLGSRLQLVGDDIFVTNPAIIRDGIASGIANAALIKVNQIGTVTETLDAMAVCREAGYRQLVSHRSGETSDSFIADLAVGSGCGEIKAGAPARGERVAKYNRLLEIAQSRPDLPYGQRV